MRSDIPSPIRDVRPNPAQRVRNVLTWLSILAAIAAVTYQLWPRAGGDPPETPPEEVLATGPVVSPSPPAPSLVNPAVAPTVEPNSGLRHPGVLVTVEQLEAVRHHVRAGEQPWASAYSKMSRSAFASMSWQPKARDAVECGYFSDPDNGCTDEWNDANAAYTQALLWYFTGTRAHADKAIQIIDAWSATMDSHTGDNAQIQAGWSGVPMVRAAELIRYTYDGWSAEAIARAEAMFHDVYLPVVRNGGGPKTNGNWDLIMLDAAMGIAVFLNDRPLFDSVIERWRARLPAYIYLSSDGPSPVRLPGGATDLVGFWYGLSSGSPMA